MLRFPALKLAALAVTLATAVPAAAQNVIRVGVLMPISGPASYFGVQGKEGIELALEQVNRGGGVNGFRIQVQYEDSACSPLQATNTVKRVLEQFKPHIVVGEECSDASLAIAPILEQAKVPMLNAGSATNQLTESGYKYVFRIFPNAQQQGEPLGRNAFTKLGARTAVLLHEKTNAGVDNADGFAKAFEAAGGKIVGRIDFGRDVNDFTPIATRIAAMGKVDVLPTFGLEGQQVRLSQALAQAKVVKGGGGSAIQMGSIWLPWGYDAKAGQAAVGYIRIVQFDPTEKRKMVTDFNAAFRAKYGADKTPTHINAHAYDTILLIAEAVRRGAKDSESLRDRFSKMREVEVTTGKITFDAKGQNSDLSVIHFVETQPDLSWKSLNW
ncbi:MAG: ABC transporter substrate-binding protein [Burkholderiales bacterium]|nr:ABC transporter substrate-binding protein [Burkholderiales bacterium]